MRYLKVAFVGWRIQLYSFQTSDDSVVVGHLRKEKKSHVPARKNAFPSIPKRKTSDNPKPQQQRWRQTVRQARSKGKGDGWASMWKHEGARQHRTRRGAIRS